MGKLCAVRLAREERLEVTLGLVLDYSLRWLQATSARSVCTITTLEPHKLMYVSEYLFCFVFLCFVVVVLFVCFFFFSFFVVKPCSTYSFSKNRSTNNYVFAKTKLSFDIK